jgi:hypothetical protein
MTLVATFIMVAAIVRRPWHKAGGVATIARLDPSLDLAHHHFEIV